MKQVRLLATTAMGLESIVADEVRNLGYDVQVENGKVLFDAPIQAIPRCNLWLRSADRVKIIVGEFEAYSFDELFENTKALPWENYISEDGQVPVSGKSVKSKLYSVPDCQAIVKKAIVDRLKRKYGLINKLTETGALFKTEVSILKDKVTLTIDTSGTGLHKRGYRVGQGEAPLKETLAAALVQLTNWKPEFPLIDPFCGSGTLLIEAALIGQNIAPGFNREFAAEDWGWIRQRHWDQAFQEAEDYAKYDQPLNIVGSDIDHRMIETSKANALEAGLGELITWKQMQVKDMSIKKPNGYIITNPPYGQRLSDKAEVEKMYRDLGEIMNQQPSWSVYTITAFDKFEQAYGKKATKKRKLFNGFIQTNYYQYFGRKE
ncbi:THUMP domain-containing class I SAM-dependent RNA methyltransferase [Oceanobacillus kimchii]|uniref:THUMP domain-containing class I SAM-dependent RNA methyltransferase n=1 Tax=Oceanobacillus kimchii TaxID=746691 RepID=UPI003C720CF4